MGKPDVAGYAYSLGAGREAFQLVVAAEQRGDWAGVVEHGRAVLAADAGHLEAHWYMALALARQHQYDRVSEHLSAAVAGDFMRWGHESLTLDALRGFHGTSAGRRYRALVERYGERFRRGVVDGVLVVGRRGKPWYPRASKSGNQSINHRGEIYAYQLDSGRFLRVSRTNAALVGYVRAPGKNELAFVSYRRVWLPPAGSAAEPYLREVQIGTINLDDAVMSSHEVVLDNVAELWLGYETSPGDNGTGEPRSAGPGDNDTGEPRSDGAGEQILIARTRAPRQPAPGTTLEPGAHARYRIDTATGRATPITASPELPALEPPAKPAKTAKPAQPADPGVPTGDALHVAYDRVSRLRIPIEGVVADWDDLGAAGSFRLDSTRKTVTLAGGELAHGHTMSWSPARGRLAFATLPDMPDMPDVLGAPCVAGARPANRPAARPATLYVVDAATGKQRALATGPQPLAPMWVSEQRLAYMDTTGAASVVRVIDVATGEDIARIEAEGGAGTDRLVGRAAAITPCSGDEPAPSLVRPAVRGG